MLSAFLGLQQQFSLAVLDRFSRVVEALREEGSKQGSSLLSDPAPGQHLLGPAAARESPSLEDKTPGRPPSAGTSRPQTAWVGPASPGASNLSPGICQTLAPSSVWPPDAISRRWSMVDGWATLGNFNLLASRRWSVPEADGEGGAAAGAGPWGGLTPTSRDSSVTRSPTHSRSTTPGKAHSIVPHQRLTCWHSVAPHHLLILASQALNSCHLTLHLNFLHYVCTLIFKDKDGVP